MTEAAKIFCQSVAFLILLAIGLTYWQWDWIVMRGVRADLNDYAQEVRRSTCSLHSKKGLLDEIDAIKDIEDATISKSEWSETDEAIRDMLRNDITSDEAALILRELKRTRETMETP